MPREPDAQLKPRPTIFASAIEGPLDHYNPHSVNHIITGRLGTEEVLVACYDDGDVVAYYTKDIASRVFGQLTTILTPRGPKKVRNPHRRGPSPKPLLRENVGNSAWGLAVHSRSRLIAVSSNRHEVTIFAFALAPSEYITEQPPQDPPESRTEAEVRRRMRNWRIIVVLGPKANNLPNISFADDEEGLAEKICAVDILGAFWVAHIWKPKQPAVYFPPPINPTLRSEEDFPSQSRYSIGSLPGLHAPR